ncbi:MAG: hypothetical protein NTY94_05305 [Alphaproteobacteria bacterium]|nr:hypothetical protein [Alphaproteobacteria bacterium]
MTQHAQPQEAPSSPAQAFAALAGELRALASAIAATRDPVAIAKALILLALARIILTLETMALAWQEGRLTLPPVPRPLSTRLACGERLTYARTAPRRPRARPPIQRAPARTARTTLPHPIQSPRAAPKHPHPIPIAAPPHPHPPQFRKIAFHAFKPTHAYFIALS